MTLPNLPGGFASARRGRCRCPSRRGQFVPDPTRVLFLRRQTEAAYAGDRLIRLLAGCQRPCKRRQADRKRSRAVLKPRLPRREPSLPIFSKAHYLSLILI